MDYSALVHRVRELVWEHVPAGSNVAVVSKGDPDLILFDQRTGLHFPQTAAGQYLGHHPASGAAAVAHLESLRQRGAQYFVVPATASWWLQYYTDLRRHLGTSGEMIHQDEVCTIYGLSKRDAGSTPTGTAAERQLRELVSAVIPDGSTLLALGSAWSALTGVGFEVRKAPLELDGVELGDAEYLVIPAGSQAPYRERARTTYATVLDQRFVCSVFALRRGRGGTTPPERLRRSTSPVAREVDPS